MKKTVIMVAALAWLCGCDETSQKTAAEPAAKPAAKPAPTPDPPKRDPVAIAKKSFAAGQKAWSDRNAKAIAQLYVPDAAVFGPGPGGMRETTGRDAIEKQVAGVFESFPDLKVGSTRVLVKDNLVVQQWIATGTHKGKLGDVEATNKSVGVHGLTIAWVNDQGFVEKERAYYDALTTLGQIGALENPVRDVATPPEGEPEWVLALGTPHETSNEKIVKDYNAAITKKDLDGVLGFLAEDVKRVDYSQVEDHLGHDPLKTEFQSWTTAFPEFSVDVTGIWAIADFVVAELNFKGRHKGKLGSLAASNKDVDGHIAVVLHLKDGKIQETTEYSNNVEMLTQLGVLEAPKAAQ